MKKFILITTIIITMSLSDGYSQNRSIRFIEKPWSEILAQAKKENKLIFMDAFASWCGPCKWMSANMFTNDSIADFYNKTFICASFDMEKGEGLELRKKYQVRAYPSLLFINPDGELVHEKVGAYRKIQDYINLGLTALNPDQCFAAYQKKYAAGDMDPLFIKGYLERLTDAYIPVKDVLNKYFETQSQQALLNRTNWSIIYEFVEDMDSKPFEFLVKNEKEFAKLYTKDSTDSKITEVYTRALMQLTRSASMTDASYNALKQKIRESGFSGTDKVFFTSDLNLYYTRSDKQKYLDLAYDDLDKYYSDDYNMLNSISWNVLQLCSVYDLSKAKKYLEKAESWAKKSISLKSEPANHDTYAQILFKLGKKEEALNSERTAIALAKKQNISTKQYDDSLKRMLGQEDKK
jgi:thiol-disulfide isomerase/thioredoxin